MSQEVQQKLSIPLGLKSHRREGVLVIGWGFLPQPITFPSLPHSLPLYLSHYLLPNRSVKVPGLGMAISLLAEALLIAQQIIEETHQKNQRIIKDRQRMRIYN